MLRNYVFTLYVLSLLVTGQAVTVRAADACQPLFDALTKAATTPSHSYTTNTALNGGKAEGETIFANGEKYIRARGKWMRPQVTSQDVLEQEKEKEEKGKSTCQLLRRESVNGELPWSTPCTESMTRSKKTGRCGCPQAPGCFYASKRT